MVVMLIKANEEKITVDEDAMMLVRLGSPKP